MGGSVWGRKAESEAEGADAAEGDADVPEGTGTPVSGGAGPSVCGE